MNVLFMSLVRIQSISKIGMYQDLLREFVRNGHSVYILSPTKMKEGVRGVIVREENSAIVQVFIGKIEKTNYIEKGINTILIEKRFIQAIKKHFSNVHFDLVLYPTPPITLAGVVKYVKKRDGALAYLLLKDIFPEGAVELGALSYHGVKGLIYKYFRLVEKKLFSVSDRIGCMSQRNIDFIVAHNPQIDPAKVELCPNSIEVRDVSLDAAGRSQMRKKYDLPLDKTIYVFGGDLGKPQGIPFMIECLKAVRDDPNAFFLIIGAGTEYGVLERFFQEEKPRNARLMGLLPKDDYDRLIAACDVGLIFIGTRMTNPEFPCKLLGYLQARLPVLVCSPPFTITDVGKVVVDGGFGWWCESNDAAAFARIVNGMEKTDLPALGEKGYEYLQDHYTVAEGYRIITGHCGI